MDRLRQYIRAHRESLPADVKQDVAVAFTVHAAASRAQARRECEASLRHFFSFLEQRRPDIQALPESYQSFQQAVGRLAKITYEELEELGAVFGDPDYCVERVRVLKREFQMCEFICYFNQGGLIESCRGPTLDGVVRARSHPPVSVVTSGDKMTVYDALLAV